jgi:hypothetical protein
MEATVVAAKSIAACLVAIASTTMLAMQISSTDHRQPRPAVFQSADACKLCHTSQHDQWLGSMMNYGFISPTFNAFELVTVRLNPNVRTESGGPHPTANFCGTCHSPTVDGRRLLLEAAAATTRMPLQIPSFAPADPAKNRPLREYATGQDRQSEVVRQGVSCDVCHRMYLNRPNGAGIADPDLFNNSFVLTDSSLHKRGPYPTGTGAQDPAPNLSLPFFHSIQRSRDMTNPAKMQSELSTSRFCGSCHDVRTNVGLGRSFINAEFVNETAIEPFGRLENLYTEMRRGPYQQLAHPLRPKVVERFGLERDAIVECQSCHMSTYPEGPFHGLNNYPPAQGAADPKDLRQVARLLADVANERESARVTIGDLIERLRGERMLQGQRADALNLLTMAEGNPSMLSTPVETAITAIERAAQTIAARPSTYRNNHPHFFIGADIALVPFHNMTIQRAKRDQLLRAAVTLDVKGPPQRVWRAEIPGAPLEIETIATNVGAGHNVPAGFSQERQVWIELFVLKGAVAPTKASLEAQYLDPQLRALHDAGYPSDQILFKTGYLIDQARKEDGTDGATPARDGRLHDEDLLDVLIDGDIFSIANVDTPTERPQWIERDGPDRENLVKYNNALVRRPPEGARSSTERPRSFRVVTGRSKGPEAADAVEERFEVFTTVHAQIYDNTSSLRPFDPDRVVFRIPASVLAGVRGPITVRARMLFRPFPPRFLRHLATNVKGTSLEATVNEALVDRNEIVVMQAAEPLVIEVNPPMTSPKSPIAGSTARRQDIAERLMQALRDAGIDEYAGRHARLDNGELTEDLEGNLACLFEKHLVNVPASGNAQMKRVVPGKPDASYLWQILAKDTTHPMYRFFEDKPEILRLFREWIESLRGEEQR